MPKFDELYSQRLDSGPVMLATFDSRLRLCRLLVITYLVSAPLMIRGVEQMVGRVSLPIEIPVGLAIIVAFCALGFGLWARVKLVWPAVNSLRSNTEGTSAPKWQVGQIGGMTCAVWVIILGMLLRLQGSDLRTVVVFYLSGYVLLLLWFPRRP